MVHGPKHLLLAVALTALPAAAWAEGADTEARMRELEKQLQALTQELAAMRQQMAGWLGADKVLAALPLTLPDDQFASITHLNASGREIFTQMVAEYLK